MRIHHLNTGTMCPIGRRFVNGTGGIFQRARMVCHCLLVETNDGLALLQAKVRMPLVLGYFQRKADLDRNLRMANQERLRQLKSTHGHEVTIFNSHDPVDYENCRCGQH